MRSYGWLALVVILILLILITQGIVKAKLYQLQVSVSRDRLMNFELSSKVLRARFHDIFQNQDDYRSEIQRNVIESSILNNVLPSDLEAGFLEQLGIAASNAVRLMSLKPILHLQEDRKLLIIIKYAFFMERNRRLVQAIKKYEDVINSLSNRKTEMLGFSLLHQGYCLATVGQRERAILRLEQTRDDFAGTHFARTAVVLLNLLLESQRRSEQIETKELSNIEKARAFYRSGLYKRACESYQKVTTVALADSYRIGRCNEELGLRKRAIQVYTKVAANTQEPNVARLANRRLFLLGTFYRTGESLKKIAQQNASRLQDQTAISEINLASQKQQEAVVIREILGEIKIDKQKTELPTSEDIDARELFREIGRELSQNVTIKKEIQTELAVEVEKDSRAAYEEIIAERARAEKRSKAVRQVVAEKREEAEAAKAAREAKEKEAKKLAALKNREALVLPDGNYDYIRVQLNDGRNLKAIRIVLEDERFILKGMYVTTTIPLAFVKNLKTQRRQKTRNAALKPPKMEIRMETDEVIRARFARIFPAKENILVGKKTYNLKDIEEIRLH